MIEKPHLRDETIIAALRKHYAIPVVGIEFLPIGNDASAWAYHVNTENEKSYFLKIRKAISNQAGFLVPRFLQDHGISQALAPLPTKQQELWISVEDFLFILYPFIAGKEAMEIGMTDSEWKEFGSVLKRIHNTKLPPDVSQNVRHETFIPKWSSLAKSFHQQVNAQNFADPYQKEMATFWKVNNTTIWAILDRTERIGKQLQQVNFKFVLCHADIHTANILLTPAQEMFIVDWDDALFAPKERDLMFVLGEDVIQTRGEQMFFEGYGNATINQLALAYYRYEWCVQEIGDFGKRVFLTKDIGEATRREAVEGFIKLFSQGDVIGAALHTSFEPEIRKNS
jgi:spectinomycin phosphotransferase